MALKSFKYPQVNLVSPFYRESIKLGILILKCCGINSVMDKLNTGQDYKLEIHPALYEISVYYISMGKG